MKISVEVDANILKKAMKSSGAPSEEIALQAALQGLAAPDWGDEKPFIVKLPSLEDWNAAMRREEAAAH